MAQARCRICNKPLSNPISIQLGIGSVCRVTQKLEYMNERTENLFASRAEYTFGTDEANGIVFIEDKLGMKSVTNDIDNILYDIAIEGGIDLNNKKIMYKDSQGIWDGIEAVFERNGNTIDIKKIEFFPLTETDFEKAKQKLIESE